MSIRAQLMYELSRELLNPIGFFFNLKYLLET